MICNKKYHFLLPSKAGCVEYCRSNVIEFQGEGHSLHGVFHSNGFGHLLCINGSQTGSDLAGYQIMEFWDRLCSGLGARFVRSNFKQTTHIAPNLNLVKYMSVNAVGK